MSINSEIRKIAKAWGVDTKGSSIKDALKDLRTNLPFSTKTEMVEIVPEQSATGEYFPAEEGYPAGYSLNMPMDIGMLKVGGKYTVVFNGKTYNVEATSRGSEDVWLPLDGIHDIMYYEANNEPVEWAMSMMWEEELGDTITLSIYGEQEVVKQIDIKYLPIEELKTALGIGSGGGAPV